MRRTAQPQVLDDDEPDADPSLHWLSRAGCGRLAGHLLRARLEWVGTHRVRGVPRSVGESTIRLHGRVGVGGSELERFEPERPNRIAGSSLVALVRLAVDPLGERRIIRGAGRDPNSGSVLVDDVASRETGRSLGQQLVVTAFFREKDCGLP